MARAEVAALLEQIDETRGHLRQMLRGRDRATLARRPPSGNWSIVENVRHLLFAEQAHLGRYLPDGFEFSPMALAHDQLARKHSPVNTDPTDDLARVFRAWDAFHRRVRAALPQATADGLADRLVRHHKHLRAHVRVIERLLRQLEPGAGSAPTVRVRRTSAR